MTGLRNLQLLEIEGLKYLATTVVNYRGHRVICQSIIPGILNNSELASLAEYGTVDDQKTIQSNEEFHAMMKQVAEKMNIQENKVLDGEGKEIDIAGCVEIKGIRGTDKRRYIVDLQGMTPRDANFLGEENHTCLVRQELVLLYQRHKQLEIIKAEMEKYEKSTEAEKKEKMPKIEEGKELLAEIDHDAKDCVLIGDTGHDYEVSQAMGIACLLVADGFQEPGYLRSLGPRTFDSLEEFADCFELNHSLS